MKKLTTLRTKVFAAVMLTIATVAATAQTNGSGRLVKQDRDLPGFTEIEAGSAFSIKVSQGDDIKVTVETDDNYLDKIETVVKGDRLYITSMGMKNPSAMKVYISMPDLKLLDISGAARIESDGEITGTTLDVMASGASKVKLDLNVELLNSKISGASKVEFNGNASVHRSEISGAANLNALNLKTLTTNARVSGAGKASIFARDEITADLSGAGALSYYDNGQLNKISKPGTLTFTPQNPGSGPSEEISASVEATDAGDSTIVKIGDIKVSVREGNPTKITIGGSELEVDDNGNVNFKRKKQTRFDGHWGGFELGVNGYVNKDRQFDMPEGYEFLDLRMEKSVNVKLNFYEQNFNLISNKFGLTTGLGFEWNNYRFDNNVVLLKDGNDLINDNFLYARNYNKSKLVVNYLNLPLLLEYQTNRFSKKNSFHIGAGLQTGLRIGSHTKLVYQDDGRKKKDKDPGDYHINPFKYDLMVRVGWGKLNLHANYSLNTLFKNNRGPELYPFTIGIALVSW